MLEDYYVKPSTIDRVRAIGWLRKWRATWSGCKHTATLASLCIAACRCCFTLLSSHRKRAAEMLSLARLI